MWNSLFKTWIPTLTFLYLASIYTCEVIIILRVHCIVMIFWTGMWVSCSSTWKPLSLSLSLSLSLWIMWLSMKFLWSNTYSIDCHSQLFSCHSGLLKQWLINIGMWTACIYLYANLRKQKPHTLRARVRLRERERQRQRPREWENGREGQRRWYTSHSWSTAITNTNTIKHW